MENNYFAKKFHFSYCVRADNHFSDIRSGASVHYLGYMLRGHSHFEAEGVSIDVSEGELVYIPKSLPYKSFWYSADEVHLISLGFSLFPDETGRKYALQRVELDEEDRRLLLSIPLDMDIGCHGVGLLYCLLDRLLVKMKFSVVAPFDELYLKACRFIQSDPMLHVGEIARRCGVSESKLYAIFRAAGTTPIDTKQKFLCEKAVSLLVNTKMTVEEVSDTLNFSTPAYFRRVLKKHTGRTPKEIRKNLPV